jgi:putative membrane protein
VLAGLTGLMLGSLRVLWPWPNGTETNEMTMPSGDVWVPILLAIIGGVAVVAMSMLAGEEHHDEELDAESEARTAAR